MDEYRKSANTTNTNHGKTSKRDDFESISKQNDEEKLNNSHSHPRSPVVAVVEKSTNSTKYQNSNDNGFNLSNNNNNKKLNNLPSHDLRFHLNKRSKYQN